MTRVSPIRQPSRPPSRGRSVPPVRAGRPAPVSVRSGDWPEFSPHILAREGPHSVALLPRVGGGFRYALFYFQPVTGEQVLRASDPVKNGVLSELWRLECRHAEPLGWPDDPRFGVHLWRLICGPAYPADVSALSASDAAAIPHGLEWEGASK